MFKSKEDQLYSPQKKQNVDKKYNRTRVTAHIEQGYLIRISHSRGKSMFGLVHCCEKMITRFD